MAFSLQQSCRTGRTRFSYGSILPNEQVFRAVVALPTTKKTPKMYKMPQMEFFKAIGEPYKSVSRLVFESATWCQFAERHARRV